MLAGLIRCGLREGNKSPTLALFADHALTNPDGGEVRRWLKLPKEWRDTELEPLATIQVGSPRLALWLNHSVRVARRVGTGSLRARHLLGGLIAAWDDVGAKMDVVQGLINRGFAIAQFRAELLTMLRDVVRGDDLGAWAEILTGSQVLIAGYHPDDAEPGSVQDDLLDLTNDVEALAMLVVARDVVPPLSIGLFGEWGTGKSFFMGLMERRVAALSSSAGDSSSGFCRKTAQIRFNAWHYSDASLWPSLVTTIFDSLARAIRPDRSVERLSETLARTASRVQQAEERLAKTRAALEDANRVVMATQESHERPGAGAGLILAAAALTSLKEQRLSNLAHGLGLEWSNEPKPDQFDRLASELAGVANKAWATLRHFWGPSWQPRWRSVVWTAAVAGGALILWWKRGVLGWAASLWTLFPVASAATLAPSLFAVGRGVLSINRVSKQAAEERRKEQLDVIKALQDAAKQDEETVRAARAELAEAQSRLDELNPAESVADFIEGRWRSDEYRKQLGVIANIRRDFERLQNRLAAATDDPAQPSVDRIILYIDDLDRCPAARVVEVLEAVHLLLASRLFVVVVAVDPRWLRGALRARYPDLLAADDNDGADAPAAPQDYLEKIFQVPVALRPLGAGAHGKLLEALFPAQAESGQAVEGAAVTGRSDSELPSSTETDGTGSTGTPGRPRSIRTGGRGQANILHISTVERAFMQKLDGIMRTPRAIKRFASTYRLLRVTQLSLPQGGVDPEFRLAMVLLALQTGYPRQAQQIFELFRRSTEGKAESVLDGIRPRPHLADASSYENAITANMDATARARWERIHAWVHTVLGDADLLDADIVRVVRTIRIVERFSFGAGSVC